VNQKLDVLAEEGKKKLLQRGFSMKQIVIKVLSLPFNNLRCFIFFLMAGLLSIFSVF
jgi:hypothetical protein